MRPDELERRLRERLDALGPAPRAELLHVLRMPDFERADRIGSYWGNQKTQTFAELLTTVRDRSSGRCWSARKMERSSYMWGGGGGAGSASGGRRDLISAADGLAVVPDVDQRGLDPERREGGADLAAVVGSVVDHLR